MGDKMKDQAREIERLNAEVKRLQAEVDRLRLSRHAQSPSERNPPSPEPEPQP